MSGWAKAAIDGLALAQLGLSRGFWLQPHDCLGALRLWIEVRSSPLFCRTCTGPDTDAGKHTHIPTHADPTPAPISTTSALSNRNPPRQHPPVTLHPQCLHPPRPRLSVPPTAPHCRYHARTRPPPPLPRSDTPPTTATLPRVKLALPVGCRCQFLTCTWICLLQRRKARIVQ